jgi:hypothetical protein
MRRVKHDILVVVIKLLKFSTKIERQQDFCFVYNAACVEFDFVKGSHVRPDTDDTSQDGN